MALDLSNTTVKSDAIVANQPVRSSGQTSKAYDQFNVIEIDSDANLDAAHKTDSTSCNSRNTILVDCSDSDQKTSQSSIGIETLGSTSNTTPNSVIEEITPSSSEIHTVTAETSK